MRFWRRLTVPSYRRCGVPGCGGERSGSASAWCQDHTDAIMAGPEEGYRREAAERVGARRWALHAEVMAERERAHVAVIEGILAQSNDERELNRFCWDARTTKSGIVMGMDLGERVDELLALREPRPCPTCGTVVPPL